MIHEQPIQKLKVLSEVHVNGFISKAFTNQRKTSIQKHGRY